MNQIANAGFFLEEKTAKITRFFLTTAIILLLASTALLLR